MILVLLGLLVAILAVLVVIAIRVREITLTLREELTPQAVFPTNAPAVPLHCGHTASPFAIHPGGFAVCRDCHERA